MKYALLAVAVMACASEPQVTPQTAPRYTRPLITDRLAFGFERPKVRGVFEQGDWCRRRTWPGTDEFVVCERRPYLNQSTPPMFALVQYDAEERATAFAVFTPVPCRMYGRCDWLMGRTVAERDFVDHDRGLRANLVEIGEAARHRDDELPSMQERMVDALEVELDHRFGAPIWKDPQRYGQAWATRTSEIGLFVEGNGSWVVETHELRLSGPPGLNASR